MYHSFTKSTYNLILDYQFSLTAFWQRHTTLVLGLHFRTQACKYHKINVLTIFLIYFHTEVKTFLMKYKESWKLKSRFITQDSWINQNRRLFYASIEMDFYCVFERILRFITLNIFDKMIDNSVILYYLPFLEELYECHVQALAGMKSWAM